MDFENLALANDSLKCSLCSNHLSHFPIYISGDKRNICNQCYSLVPEKASYVQNEVYETVAQFIKFPCRYQEEGCLEKLFPVSITEHERDCIYRTIKCPTAEFTKCTWEGSLPNVLHHCQDKHCNLMLKNGEFQIDLSHSHQRENLLEHDSLLFIIFTTFFSINKCLEFSIFNIASEKNKKIFTCEITFTNGSRNLTVKCNTTSFADKKITEIFLNALQDTDNNESSAVIAKIGLEKIEDDDDTVDDKINEEFLTQLKCFNCGDYAMPPIYQDLNQPTDKQIKCYECNNETNSNTFGSTASKGLRNISLDKIASLLNYPCKYRKNGCIEIYKPEQMKKHRPFCPFGNHICPVNEYVGCKWSGLGKDIATHIEASHQAMIKANSTEISECLFNTLNGSTESHFSDSCKASKSNSIKCYIIKFSEHLFQLNFTEIDQNYYWAVQLIGQSEDNFMFELELIDKSSKKQRLLLRQPCTLLQTRNQLFTLKNSFCYFQKNQIESFICGQIITFKVTIYK